MDHRRSPRHAALLSAGLVGLILAAAAAPASAGDADTYRAYRIDPNGARTTPVVGSTLRGYLSARILFPSGYRRLANIGDTLRFRTATRNCRYTVTFSLRFRLAPDGTAVEHVAADLQPTTPQFLLEQGTRNLNAWRVIRLPSNVVPTDPRVRLRAELARRINAPAGTVPAGQAVWLELRASATSTRGSECHAGTWRDALGPRIGDALASTRVTRAFIPPA